MRPDGCYVDCTFGRGGHSRALLRRLNAGGRLLALDKDPQAVAHAHRALGADERFSCAHGSFSGLGELAERRGLRGAVDGVLFDLGVSSPQLEDAARGFSFRRDGPLDMRMNPAEGAGAADWLRRVSAAELRAVLRDFGEERYAGRIARAVVAARAAGPVATTRQLAGLIEAAVPAVEKNRHPATRAFQAIRMYVNNELNELAAALAQAPQVLRSGGRLAVISFHSGEDRIVKRFIKDQSGADPYPAYLPIPAAQARPKMRAVGRPLRPTQEEVNANPRSRSAVLRVAERTAWKEQSNVPG